jgi:hypothetical protein
VHINEAISGGNSFFHFPEFLREKNSTHQKCEENYGENILITICYFCKKQEAI